MDCKKCKEETCIYKKDLLLLPCEDCIYRAFDEWSKECSECINEKCQFKKSKK